MTAPFHWSGAEPLLSLAAGFAGVEARDAERLCAQLLVSDHEGDGPLGGNSELNADGWPLQACLTFGGGRLKSRLIGDPGWFLRDPADRLAASRRAMDAVFKTAGAASLLPAAEDLLARVVEAGGGPQAFRRGFIWLAAGLGTGGAAVYVDAQPLGAGAWPVAADWLGSLLPAPPSVLEPLSAAADLGSLSLEGSSPADARAKVYFRLRQAAPLDRLGQDLFTDPTLLGFLRRAVGDRAMNLGGLTLSVGFSLADGRVSDVKADLCAHCLPQPAESWAALIADAASAAQATSPDLLPSLRSGACEPGNLGLGVDRDGAHRFNLYLKPPGLTGQGAASGRPADLTYRLERAVAFLEARQDSDGAWRDYHLPVGPASHWVTGFVGCALIGAAAGREAATRGAGFLLRTQGGRPGWGYNDTTPIDADSTGFALRLIHGADREATPADLAALLDHWRPGGGFATYQAPDCWADVHPCVTAAAFAALPQAARRERMDGLMAYLRATARPDGTWPAYWWRDHLYSTWHHLRLLKDLGLSGLFPPPAEPSFDGDPSCFDLAYAAGLSSMAGRPACAEAWLNALFERQRADGGWPGGFNLRVTDPGCARPWEHPEGLLYKDEQGLVTTASAVMILSEMRDGRL